MNTVSQEKITVVFGADNKYAMQFAVTLKSLVMNLKSTKKLEVFIIDGGIKRINKQKIAESFKNDFIEIKYVLPDMNLLKGFPTRRHFSIAAYFRILIPLLLPDSYDRVIYLDCDLIVQDNIEKIWDIDLDDDYIAACVDKKMWPWLNKRMPDPSKQHMMFNSGVMVMNLLLWRKDDIITKTIDYVSHYQSRIQIVDQEVLNVLFADRWKKLEQKWNVWPCDRRGITTPAIIHFVTSAKPWDISGQAVPDTEIFYKYLDMTAWRGWRITPRRAILQKIFWKYRRLKYLLLGRD